MKLFRFPLMFLVLFSLAFGANWGTYFIAGLGSGHFGVHLDNYVSSTNFGQNAYRTVSYSGGFGVRSTEIGEGKKARMDFELQSEYFSGGFRLLMLLHQEQHSLTCHILE